MANTPQYRAVLKQLKTLTNRLEQKGNAEAKGDLLLMLQTKHWVGHINDPKAADLIYSALNRIKTDVTQYEVFIGMLKEIPQVEDIVKDMTGIITLLHSCKYILGTINIAACLHLLNHFIRFCLACNYIIGVSIVSMVS